MAGSAERRSAACGVDPGRKEIGAQEKVIHLVRESLRELSKRKDQRR